MSRTVKNPAKKRRPTPAPQEPTPVQTPLSMQDLQAAGLLAGAFNEVLSMVGQVSRLARVDLYAVLPQPMTVNALMPKILEGLKDAGGVTDVRALGALQECLTRLSAANARLASICAPVEQDN